MADIARLGFSAETNDLKNAKAALDALVPSAQSAEGAVEGFNAAASGMGAATGKFNSAALGAVGSTDRLSKAALASGTAMGTVQRAAVGAGASLATLGASVTRVGNNFAQADAHVEAYRAQLLTLPAAATASTTALNRLGKSANDNISRLQATPGNIAAQFQDIGVTAAAGMSPMLIALQQGTQLAAAFAGGGLGQLGAAFKNLLSPVTLLTIAFVALIAYLIELAMKWFEAGSAADKLAESLKKGAQAADFFGEAQSMVGKVFDTTTGKLKSHNEVLQQYVKLQAQANILAAQAARLDATKAVAGVGKPTIMENVMAGLSGFGASAGDTTGVSTYAGAKQATAAFGNLQEKLKPLQDTLSTFSNAVNSTGLTVGGLNKATDVAINNIDKLAKAHKLANRDIIDTKKAVLDLATARGQEFANSDVITSINQGHLTPSLITPSKAHKPRGKTDAQKFQDIVEGAQNDIATENAKAEAINQTALAAATLEEKTKLLNAAHSQELKLTPPMIAQINQLAAAYGAAKVEADRAATARDLTKTTDAELTSLKKQGDLIGVYGEKLAYATEYAKEYAAAVAKFGNDKMGLMFFSTTEIPKSAGAIATQQVANDNKRYFQDTKEGSDQNVIALQREEGQIGLTREALATYTIETQLLNKAKQQHLDMTPELIAQIHNEAVAYGTTTDAIQHQIEQINSFRDAYRGFFSTMIDGLRQGDSVWKSFGNAVMSVVNAIINRLLTMNGGVLDKLVGLTGKIGGLFGGSQVSPGLAAQFDSVIPHAKGGAFTNDIYSSPTLFKFARGGAMGVMGEAGPEAVVPLKRGPDGSLGVQVHGSQVPPIRVIVDTNDDRFNAYVDERSTGVVARHAPTIAQAGSDVAERRRGWNQNRSISGRG